MKVYEAAVVQVGNTEQGFYLQGDRESQTIPASAYGGQLQSARPLWSGFEKYLQKMVLLPRLLSQTRHDGLKLVEVHLGRSREHSL